MRTEPAEVTKGGGEDTVTSTYRELLNLKSPKTDHVSSIQLIHF